MIQKKICMLGSFAVGKTSLVRQFVTGIFSERYLATIGVKIDRKIVEIDGQVVTLIVWDIAGEDGLGRIKDAYLRGASGYLLVVDKTRKNTLDAALDVHRKTRQAVGIVPHILLANKWDLSGKEDMDDAVLAGLEQEGWRVLKTSAKTGLNVEEAFHSLARLIMDTPQS